MFYIPILYKQISLYSVDGTKNTARLGRFISDNQTKYNPFLAIYLKVYINTTISHSLFKFLEYLSIIYFYLMFISLSPSPFFAFINQNTKKKYSM